MGLQEAAASIETQKRAKAFVSFAREMGICRGNVSGLQQRVAAGYGSSGVSILAKAAIEGVGLSSHADFQLGTPAAYAAAFTESLQSVGAFDRLLADMNRAPLNSRWAINTANATGYEAVEGKAKKVSRMTFGSGELLARTAACIIVVSEELLRYGAQAEAILSNAITAAVSAAQDSMFLTDVLAGVTPIAAAGTVTAAGIADDIAEALAEITTSSGSRIHVVASPANVKGLLTMVDTAGGRAFADVTLTGGTLFGLPLSVSDAAGTDVYLIDASGFVAGADNLSLRFGREASIEMDDAPTNAAFTGSPPAPAESTLVSMFQTNSVAIRSERRLAWTKIRSDAAAVLSGVSWGTGSP